MGRTTYAMLFSQGLGSGPAKWAPCADRNATFLGRVARLRSRSTGLQRLAQVASGGALGWWTRHRRLWDQPIKLCSGYELHKFEVD